MTDADCLISTPSSTRAKSHGGQLNRCHADIYTYVIDDTLTVLEIVSVTSETGCTSMIDVDDGGTTRSANGLLRGCIGNNPDRLPLYPTNNERQTRGDV